ncbi:DUF6445 family protein [Caulobacter sp.]|uniref:DUF6445 family protein n=1 Tax=Caulobacter sp. TaxID=78 RepID=UPI001B1BA167|nr:DUF6445 family protein [Caulobacter sp.]MBO9545857.1 hypothetical protein [Caulobacter sp.]
MTLATAVRPLLLGPNISVRLRKVGQEQQPLLIVDDVLADPWAMVDAARAADFYRPSHTNYPGLNANLPEAYYRTVVTALRGPIEAAFGVKASAVLKFFGFFALATTPVERAKPVQTLPHLDGPDPNRLAMVHYFCQGDFGGTGFFRHAATGFESVDGSRIDAYATALEAELAQERTSFAGADTPGYDLIDQAEPVFNRLIVYRGHVLHAGLLGRGGGAADPATGRLTANGFIEAVDTG